MEDPNAHEGRGGSCDCPLCLLRKLLMAAMKDSLQFQPGSPEDKWITYQKAMAHLRGHAEELANGRAKGWARQLGLEEYFKSSGLGPLTGYQLMARDAKPAPTLQRVREEMKLIATLITPLMVVLLDECRSLHGLVRQKDSRWRFFDHAVYFDALLMLRTVMYDMGCGETPLMLEKLESIEEMGRLVDECNKLLASMPESEI